MKSISDFTTVICTYNRADLLRYCLESLCQQEEIKPDFPVLVVNNNCTDHTAEVVATFQGRLPGLRMVIESQQGLSHARNRGYQEAQTPWLVYLDDDAKAKTNFITRCQWMIDQNQYQVFGGVFLPWYKYGKPRWYRDAYGSNKLPYQQVTSLKNPHFASGGIMAMRKELLEQYGGFRTDIGMIGNTMGYTEETELQARFRKDGIAIAYDPEWIIYHLVAQYKLELSWFFKSAFSLGRDKVRGGLTPHHPAYLFLIALTMLGLSTARALANLPKLWFNQNYYIENWLLDSFRKSAKRVGMIYTGLLLDTEA